MRKIFSIPDSFILFFSSLLKRYHSDERGCRFHLTNDLSPSRKALKLGASLSLENADKEILLDFLEQRGN
jgi:hypothetical protein